MIVPGHALWLGGPSELDLSWVLADYQSGEGPAFEAHLRAGVECAASDPRSWLITSGGATRAERPGLTEADTYLALANERDWFGHVEVAARSSSEPRARDSYENLLFALLAFREQQAHWPRRVTVCGWGFKAARFQDHARALGWPERRMAYIGSGRASDEPAALRAEQRARAQFGEGPNHAELVSKRMGRSLGENSAPPGLQALKQARISRPALE